MEVRFASAELGATMNDLRKLNKKYGKLAPMIANRLVQLRAAETLEQMRHAPGHCEELVGQRHGQFSIRLSANWRLIFEPDHDPIPVKDDGGLNWSAITIVRIINVEDYH